MIRASDYINIVIGFKFETISKSILNKNFNYFYNMKYLLLPNNDLNGQTYIIDRNNA